MYKSVNFKKKLITTAVASVAAGFGGMAFAQDGEIEEVMVTGIRASLQQSMDQKRSASGVQDVITAEDIGKFPDTNLAESMQRIPGVSINREGGEGSRVTVRGLGAEYNLVTHNGRTIAKTTGDRSFNFADMSAELVAGVAVSKTSSAIRDSGGMGATIDISSIRPLSNPGQKAIVSAKMISDTSWAGGDTPEFFGLYANTFADDTIGFSIALGKQERESSLARAMIDNGWKTFDGETTSAANSPDGGIYSLPQSARYKFERDERERLNGQLVLQWAPTEDITATLDYDTYERSVHSDRNEVSAWFTYPTTGRSGVWASERGVSTPLIYSENYKALGDTTTVPNDLSMAGGLFAHKYTGDTVGLNVEWQVNDRLKLAVDLATSEAEDAPDSKYGSDANLSTAAFTRTSTSIDTTGEIFAVINGGGDATAQQMQITGSVFGNSLNTSNVDQYQLKGNFVVNDESNIDFGISSTEVFNRNRQVNVQQNGWGGLGTAGQMADAFAGSDASLISRFDGSFGNFGLAGNLPSGSTLADGTNLSNGSIMDHFFDWDFATVQAKANSLYNTPAIQAGAGLLGNCGDGVPSVFCASTEYDKGTDRRTTETTDAFYVQYNFERGIFKANLGGRYETTDVVSTAASSLYTGTNWGADTEISFTGQTTGYTTKTASYSRFLPNLDLMFNVSDDVLLRASVSKSMARPSYSDIAGGVSVGTNFGRQVGYATGEQGNPSLKPYESTNLDFSAEWYFDETSYASFGLFSKKISNFIARETVTLQGKYADEMPTLYNPYDSQYVRDAIAAGAGASGQTIRTWIFDNRNGQPGVTRDTSPGAASFAGSIVGQPSDGLVNFEMSTPTNSGDDRDLLGYEFALQHMFGESGFGGQFNYTAVLSDLSWNVRDSSQDQRPLLGVSDSANLVGLYERDGWNIRIAYNWRDKFLTNYNDEGNQSPQFVRPYYQIDLGISYEVTENIKISLDGINVTENDYEIVARTDGQLLRHDEYGARWMLGASYSF
jgi:TonB-dependent receptor